MLCYKSVLPLYSFLRYKVKKLSKKNRICQWQINKKMCTFILNYGKKSLFQPVLV